LRRSARRYWSQRDQSYLLLAGCGSLGSFLSPSCALTRRRAGTDFAVLWNRRKAAVGLGVLCLLTALSAVVFRLSRERKPELQITFLGYTNVLLSASSSHVSYSRKALFVVTNAGNAQIAISSMYWLYRDPTYRGQMPGYLIMPTDRIDPGESVLVTSFVPSDETRWRRNLAYSYPDPKKRLVDFLGGKGNFFGLKVGYLADAFFPTQKLHWAHSEWITNTVPRRYNISAPPPPFRFEPPTNTGTFP
jgi:hypothetical protein